MKQFIKRFIPDVVLRYIARLTESMLIKSIHAAIREQDLLPIYQQLKKIIPDITHQYSSFNVDSEYLNTNVKAQHAFQISLVNEAIQLFCSSLEDRLIIVDIGDSAGTHIQYIKELNQGRKIRSLSVNIDNEAVERIKKRGLEAICARAEDLTSLSIEADIFLSFEMLEHLPNPGEFLHNLAQIKSQALVITVPFLSSSRVGLHHIRNHQKHKVNPENTHIFELSPEDWRLIFKHSGWAVVTDRIYYRYPKKSLFSLWLKNYWRKHDFEGFYGAILKPDNTWSELYNGW